MAVRLQIISILRGIRGKMFNKCKLHVYSLSLYAIFTEKAYNQEIENMHWACFGRVSIELHKHEWKFGRTVRQHKLSLTTNDPQSGNDPLIGLQMIQNHE